MIIDYACVHSFAAACMELVYAHLPQSSPRLLDPIYYTLHPNPTIPPSKYRSPLPYPYIPTLDDTDGIGDHSGLLSLTLVLLFFDYSRQATAFDWNIISHPSSNTPMDTHNGLMLSGSELVIYTSQRTQPKSALGPHPHLALRMSL